MSCTRMWSSGGSCSCSWGTTLHSPAWKMKPTPIRNMKTSSSKRWQTAGLWSCWEAVSCGANYLEKIPSDQGNCTRLQKVRSACCHWLLHRLSCVPIGVTVDIRQVAVPRFYITPWTCPGYGGGAHWVTYEAIRSNGGGHAAGPHGKRRSSRTM